MDIGRNVLQGFGSLLNQVGGYGSSPSGDQDISRNPFVSSAAALPRPSLAQMNSGKPPTKLSEHDFEDFEELMKLNDQLSMELSDGFEPEDLEQYALDPPRVVVVGLTSAGKSSLLERVLGFRIFPVKDTVCTRRPFRVHMRHDAQHPKDTASFRFIKSSGSSQRGKPSGGEEEGKNSGMTFSLPEDIDGVRHAIERAQRSESQKVAFTDSEIFSEIVSNRKDTFAFTDLPGIFLVSEQKMGKDFAASRAENERQKQHTLDIAKKYISMKNTIVLVVISATDWMHSMNNDNLVSYLAEWLEEIRKSHEVPVYGVITKLDLQDKLSENSPIRKILTGDLPSDHVLHGLKVLKWIPMVSSPEVLALGPTAEAARRERHAVLRCLKGSVPSEALKKLPIGRSALLMELKTALLRAISRTHQSLRQGLTTFLADLDRRLEKLPRPASAAEKRRIFDQRLKVLETTLSDLIGPRGRYLESNLDGGSSQEEKSEEKSASASASAGRGGGRENSSLRMRLMVELPQKFDARLRKVASERGDLIQEVSVVLNQAVLEQGGSFDSDLSFASLSTQIIQRYEAPCMDLVRECSLVVRDALRFAVKAAYSEYPELERMVLGTLGVLGEDMRDEPDPNTLFGFLTTSAKSKVANLLDALQTMACFHPMWRNFDTLFHKVLSVPSSSSSGGGAGFLESRKQKSPELQAAETIQSILGLPELAQTIRRQGQLAIEAFQSQQKSELSLQYQERIRRHFARIEVMAYIVRLNLLSSVYPIILRDLRDGLFRGVVFGNQPWDHGVLTVLRMQLVFEESVEQEVLRLMEPSQETIQLRKSLAAKRQTLLELKQRFSDAQQSLQRLMEVFAH